MHRPRKYRLARSCALARGTALAVQGSILVGLAVAALLVASPATASDSGGKFNPPKSYYLSVGDSLGFGLQLDKLFALLDAGTYTPDAFNTGYTDDFAAQMRQIRPDQQVENLSCGGETTDTMINGGCVVSPATPVTPATIYSCRTSAGRSIRCVRSKSAPSSARIPAPEPPSQITARSMCSGPT